MERLYCSRCLKAHRDDTLEMCPRKGCDTPRPEVGWPSYLGDNEMVDGRFRVIKMIGSGGAGLTYQCFDLERREVVALKVLHPDRRHGMLAQRLALEGQVLELLSHTGVVPFRGIKVMGSGPAWLATTFAPGGTLADQVREFGPLPLTAVADLAVQLAESLLYIHGKGIVHRDIKPSNLLLQSSDISCLDVRVADFGIARMFGNGGTPLGLHFTQTGLFVGTPEFAAPEQMRGERDVGPAVDKYALGAVLHFAATGESLFKSSSPLDWLRRRDSVWSPSQRPRVAAEVFATERELAMTLDRLIDGLMASEPQDRLSLGVLREALSADSSVRVGSDVEISATLCEVPEPRGMENVAVSWGKKTTLLETSVVEPAVSVTRVQEPLSELLSDSWTTGLENSEEWRDKLGRRTGRRQAVARQSVVSHPSEVEIHWLPRATRRKRALLRTLAAVLLLSFGLEVQDIRSEQPAWSLETAIAEASAWLGVQAKRERALPEKSPRARKVVAVASSSPSDSRPELGRNAEGAAKPMINRSGRAIAAAKPAGKQTISLRRTPQKGSPGTQNPVENRGAPQIVVGSDDVWGVKSRRTRTVGDALAYDSDDEEALERIFGDY